MSSTRDSKPATRNFKKIALVALGVLLASQLPFAYRRYRLGRLRAAVAELNARRAPAPTGDPFEDHAGVFHVHSALGGHSEGRPEEIVSAAAANGLAFVVMTEHPAAGVNTAEATLRGAHRGVLFVNGSELVARGGARLFVVPGFASPAPAADSLALPELIARAKAEGRLALLAYPEQLREWPPGGYDGIEVYNLYTNARAINYARLLFDALWSYASHPDLLFATFYERPSENLKRWDEVNAAGAARASAVAGSDAHANVGFDFGWAGGKLFGVKFDPYERSFRVVRNHVLLRKGEPPSAEGVIEALRVGRGYIAFDLFGDAAGFRFHADNASGLKTMGEEIALAAGGPVRLRARAPVECRLLFFRDGEVFAEAGAAMEKELIVDRPGVYRVEAYLDQLGGFLDGKPWIISNPIYVR